MLFLLGLFICSSCSSSDDQKAGDEKEAYNVIGQASKILYEKYGFISTGAGGSMYDKVRSLSLRLRTKEPMNKDTARAFLVNSALDFLEIINNDKEIRPYLIKYPATLENVDVAIFSKDSNYYPLIAVVSTYPEDTINFATKDKDQEFGYKTEEDEPFAEAYAIVKEQGLLKSDYVIPDNGNTLSH
jgi:hypothetical protein